MRVGNAGRPLLPVQGVALAVAVIAISASALMGLVAAVGWLEREQEPVSAAEKECNDLLAPGEAESEERTKCLARELRRPPLAARDIAPTMGLALLAAGAVVSSRLAGRSGRRHRQR